MASRTSGSETWQGTKQKFVRCSALRARVREVARRVLADLTPPYKPNQDPNDFLREFFRSALRRLASAQPSPGWSFSN